MTAHVRGAVAATVFAMCLMGVPQPVAPLDDLQLSLDAMQGAGWRTGAIRARLRMDAAGTTVLQVEVRDLALPAPLQQLSRADFECTLTPVAGTGWKCPDASLTLELAGGSRVALSAVLALDPATRSVQVHATRQSFAGGSLDFDLELAPDLTSLDARVVGVDAARLQAMAPAALPVSVGAGRISGDLYLRRVPAGGEMRVTLDLGALGFSDDTGLRAAQDIDATLTLDARMRGGAWDFQLDAAMARGAVFVDPLLLDVPGEPLRAALSGRYVPDVSLRLDRVELSDPGVAALRGAAEFALAPLPVLGQVELALRGVSAAALYERYLRPLAGAGALSDLSVSGLVSAQLDWRAEGAASASVSLEAVNLGDVGGRFALLGLGGELHWTRAQPLRASRLQWADLQLYSLDFGAGALQAEFADDGARLVTPLVLALLDGQLRLARLQAANLGRAAQRIEADLSLTPVSLERLSERLGWLPLSGSVSGEVAHLVYEQQRLMVAGDVHMRLFGGHATVSGLELSEPFGVVPRLHASLRLQDIDLAVLTQAMSFGSIEGKLEGRIDGLVLQNWQPVAFDAVLATPTGDTSRRRISQRAVDNLASLGGANAVLSSTFLRIFKQFSYERLGLSCRLRAGVCEMGGVQLAPRGYYIVKGGGPPPRVDVIGFNDRVDWVTLIDRLRAVASSPGPVVQ